MMDLRIIPRPAFALALESNLRRLGPAYKAYGHFVTAIKRYLEADAVWLYRFHPHDLRVEEKFFDGSAAPCDERLVVAFASQERPEIPKNVLLSPLRVHDRLLGIVSAGRTAAFARGAGRALNRLCWVLETELARREEERLARLLDRIKEKVVAELRPQDLAYLILDSLHELVHYDHSASLLTYEVGASALRVEAEKIVWTKAKSSFIGHEVPVTPELADALKNATKPIALRAGDVLHGLLDYHPRHRTPESTSILCAPLFFHDELLGLLRIAGWKRPAFNEKEVEVVERFLPAAVVSLRNVRVKLSLERQAMQAELRASLVTLARAVAHDVNNAIGAILPLAEQARDELRRGRLDEKSLSQDLDTIIEKAALCKRIFSNMLRVGAERAGSAPLDVNELVEEMRPMLEAQVAPRSIELELDLADELPLVRFSRPHLERVVWNLVTNAVEALPRGGRVLIATRRSEEKGAFLSVSDDGPGIPAEVLSRVQEPFFTTKPNGTGLGLSICRALAWQYGGALEIQSSPGRGTEVSLRLAVSGTE